jgi:amino acid adenylation domain-containing protein
MCPLISAENGTQEAAYKGLVSGFCRSVTAFPDRPALEIDGLTLTYKQLFAQAASIARALDAGGDVEGPPLTAVFGQRSFTAFAGVLASLLRGHGYVPLNPTFPTERTVAMLVRSQCRSLVADAVASGELEPLLAESEPGLRVVLPDERHIERWRLRWPQHSFTGAKELEQSRALEPKKADSDGIAYLLFTSGSTGKPKGVMVRHRNVTAFIEAMVQRYGITEHDRLSQTFDLTFDLSAFDMFVAWERGACLCCPTQKQKMLPGKYINDARLTVWFSVPSTAILMSRLRMLKPGQFPHLRISLFCGEALPMEVVQTWEQSCPNSIIENLYGPTELTIACTLYRWDADTSPGECELGVVPIGYAYPDMLVRVVDPELKEVNPGETGELLMTGPQLTAGYWQALELTEKAFVTPSGCSQVFYRTGDRVRRPSKDGAPLVYLGRMDNQIKIQGYRVELGEVEAVLREESGVEHAIAIGWPVTPSGADGLVAFLATDSLDTEQLLAALRKRLPPYMHVREVRCISEMPLNANGKVDRHALRQLLERPAGAARG